MEVVVASKLGDPQIRRTIIDVELDCLPVSCRIQRYGYPRAGERYLERTRGSNLKTKLCLATDTFEEPKLIVVYNGRYFGKLASGFYIVTSVNLYRLEGEEWKRVGTHAELEKTVKDYPKVSVFQQDTVAFTKIPPGRYEVDEHGYGYFIGVTDPKKPLKNDEDAEGEDTQVVLETESSFNN